jgi:DNA-binding MarR family transcriptional regulator
MSTPNVTAGPPTVEASVDSLAVAAAAFASAFERWANRKAIEAGLSAPRLRLLNIVHCHGPQKMADLADALAVTPRNVTALVDGLEAEGLIRRLPHSTDRRVTLVELACNSDRVASQFRAFQDSLGGLFADLDEDERATLLRLLTALHDRIHAEAGRPSEATAMADA